ncbi:MAG: methyltransferase domain-containing protein [Myxococcota bacterium]
MRKERSDWGPAAGVREALAGALSPALRVAYRATHAGLAIGCGGAMRMAYLAIDRRALKPYPARTWKVLAERFDRLLERDWKNAERGYYPRELLFSGPPGTLAKIPEGLLEVGRVARRKQKNRFQDLPKEIDHDRFPSYYLRNFHWQTDGWFSERSARMYDFEVEVLFGGTADIMRRMAIPPLVDAVCSLDAPRILDVACGTGRYLSQLSRAIPRARLFGLDLSPHYIKEAQRNLAQVPELSLVVDNAEHMPFADESFDAVSSVFLFHELPRSARRAVASEIARVLRPGGVLSLCDSAQLVDSPELEPAFETFAAVYHEPYYLDYVRQDLAPTLEAAGLEITSVEPHSVSKVVVARKKLSSR